MAVVLAWKEDVDAETEQHLIPLIRPDGTYLLSTFLLYELDSDHCRIVMTWDNQRLEATADDFFEAFCSIRRDLWSSQLMPACYGAHLRAFPSGMARSMGGGKMLYRLTLGKQALTKDLVKLFGSGDDIIPSTVDDQRQFFDEWVGSLGRN